MDHRASGIRPSSGNSDDQKRTLDVAQAFAAGADYIVVGRPIRQADDPRAAASAMQLTIADTLAIESSLNFVENQSTTIKPLQGIALSILASVRCSPYLNQTRQYSFYENNCA